MGTVGEERVASEDADAEEAAESGADGVPISLLLVDDDPDVAAVTAMHLERQNQTFDVHVEHCAADALERLEPLDVDCVVSDYEMPRRDGLEFLRDVRDRHPGLPFVLFTGRGSEEIASEAISAGVTDYLQKGSGIEQYAVLANRVENAVARRRSETAAAETESRYRSLVESSPHAILVHDGETVLFANERLLDVVGYEDRAAIDAADPSAFVHSEDLPAIEDRAERVLGGEEALDWFEYRIRRPDDEVRWVESRAVPVRYQGTRASQVVLRDVTERHRHVERLETLHEATRRLLTAPDRGAVAAITVDVLDDVFRDPIGMLWRYDAPDESLVPLAGTERAMAMLEAEDAASLPVLGPESLEIDVFRAGDPRVIEDYPEQEDAVTDRIATTFLFPLDQHGMLGTAATRAREFDRSERELVGILARSVLAALDRLAGDADRE